MPAPSPNGRRLALFDIDATLVTTKGLGIGAMRDAARDAFGRDLTDDHVPTAGRLDPLIMADMLRLAGIDATPDALTAWRTAYAGRLRQVAGEAAARGDIRALPGALDIVARLESEAGAGLTLGVLTGNFAETGTIKLEAAGFRMDAFRVRVWGDESPHDPPARDHLPGVGIERFRALHDESIDGARVTIIGDTIHDIACAKAHGCRSIGVATGWHDAARLESAGADLVLDDLTDTERIANWILTG
ncbi:MAG: HAD family hydrolase [Phycisphaerales bacterium]